MTTKNFGVRVELKFTENLSEGMCTLRNVTEIHYGYRSMLGHKRVAFESDIHSTGVTYSEDEIEQFETYPETSKAESF
jgi:hypothetical protein